MEELLHYVWKHKLFPLGDMKTTDGLPVEVIDTGLPNRHAGPDFFNAKVRIGETLWVGNVEIHRQASDWYRHGHDHDPKYDNVVLHVAKVVDTEVRTANGHSIPQMELPVPQSVTDHYQELVATDHRVPCHQVIPLLSPLTVHGWLSALLIERLERKTQSIGERLARCEGSWEAAYFSTLARNYGFGVNGDAFEAWAATIPLHAVDHHRDDLFQIEAIFMGQAGLLQPEAIPERHRADALADGYFSRLQHEYQYLAHKFGLKPIDCHQWRFLRLRPQNFPHIRLSQLARLYYERRAGLSQVLACQSAKELADTLRTSVTPYWQNHYTFGAPCEPSDKTLSAASLNLLMINTAIPMLFAYGRHKGAEALCDRAYSLLEELRAEDNHIVRMWRECGLKVAHAGDSQALIQLKTEYCDRKDCLRCRFGYEFIKGKKGRGER